MLSASRDARLPGRAERQYPLSSSPGATTTGLKPEQIQLYSNEPPSLPAGRYVVTAEQELKVQQTDAPLNLPRVSRTLHVPGPHFRLLDEDGVHSVYPPAGQQESCNTLAHVVLKNPMIPWERPILVDDQHFNKVPWLAVLSFTEDELVLSENQAKACGFATIPTRFGTVTTRAGQLQQNNLVASPLNSPGFEKDFLPAEPVDVVLVTTDLLEAVFGRTSHNGRQIYNVLPFAFMSHIREVHGSFTSNPEHGESPLYSIVVSPRTGPTTIKTPVRTVSILVSLEGVPNLNVQGKRWAALVALYAWDWMCVPPDRNSFLRIMRGLGRSLQPLRVPDQSLKALKEHEEREEDSWLRDRLANGFTVKEGMQPDGTLSQILIRGPLTPVMTEPTSQKQYSLTGKGLAEEDEETGLLDISSSSAWYLGRGLALADRTFTTSLLRLRGKARALSVRRSKSAISMGRGGMGLPSYIAALKSSIEAIPAAESLSGVGMASATSRWHRTPDQVAMTPEVRLTRDGKFDRVSYLNELESVMAELFGLPEGDSHDLRPIDPDAATVRKWIVDKMYLATVPMHYLVMDPDMLPRETMRTFCVDANWINAFIDGGLSLANHHAKDDDALRREIVKAVNKFLQVPIDNGPSKGKVIQVPHWGFLVHSVAVSAFPDLKVEALSRNGDNEVRREALHMQILAHDVLLCLFDKVPGEPGFEELLITQPSHQQGYSLGLELDETSLTSEIRPIPARSDIQPNPDNYVMLGWKKSQDDDSQVYNWDTKMMNPQSFARQAMEKMKAAEGTNFLWDNAEDVPSSILATQLGRAVLQLRMRIGDSRSIDQDQRSLIARPPQLYVPPAIPATSPVASQRISAGVSRPLPTKTAICTGPRPRPTKVQMGSIDTNTARESIIQHIEPTPMINWPMRIDTFWIWSPDHPERKEDPDYTPHPINLVFDMTSEINLRVSPPRPSACSPHTTEVRIPVTMEQCEPPSEVNQALPTLLNISGTLAAPILPRLIPFDRGSQRCSYSMHLATGRLYQDVDTGKHYEDARPTPPEPPERTRLLLVITVKVLIEDEEIKSSWKWDGSFMLLGVKLKDWTGSEGAATVDINIVSNGEAPSFFYTYCVLGKMTATQVESGDGMILPIREA